MRATTKRSRPTHSAAELANAHSADVGVLTGRRAVVVSQHTRAASLRHEVVTLVKVSDQAGVDRFPTHQLLGARAGRWIVERDSLREEAEMRLHRFGPQQEPYPCL